MTTHKHETRNPADLKHHPLLKDSPMMAPNHADCLCLRASIEDHGLGENPIIINEKDQIMDGRHRVREALTLGLDSVPVSVRPDSEASDIIFNSLTARRHMAKWQTAYCLGPLIEKRFGDGKGRRLANLMPGAIHKTRENPNVSSKRQTDAIEENKVKANPFQQFLLNIGISPETWERANRVRKVLLARPDLRERFEPCMFDDDPKNAMSLEGVAKALGSITGEYAKGTVNLVGERAEHDRILGEYFEKMTSQFRFWHLLDSSRRKHVSHSLVTESRAWPAEVRMAMYHELSKNPPVLDSQD